MTDVFPFVTFGPIRATLLAMKVWFAARLHEIHACYGPFAPHVRLCSTRCDKATYDRFDSMATRKVFAAYNNIIISMSQICVRSPNAPFRSQLAEKPRS
jgi:hypothetical protein